MNTSFRFTDGRLIEDHSFTLPDGTVSDELRKAGYLLTQVVGDTDGLSYDLYEHDEKGWLVMFNTASSSCEIVVSDWPDLVELLAKLSPIVLAARDWES